MTQNKVNITGATLNKRTFLAKCSELVLANALGNSSPKNKLTRVNMTVAQASDNEGNASENIDTNSAVLNAP
jgi:hypothetical protein